MLSILHQKNLDYLKTALENGQLHHSFIFYGPEGSGKFDFAIIFAKYLQCTKRGESFCGECNNCRVSKDEFIVDSHIINFGKNESIKIDEINKIKGIIGHSSFSGNHKIVIINNAHNMTRDSRDVLLKTLEEPPDKSLSILITDELRKLPKTILSRCPAVFFPRCIPDKESLTGETEKDFFEISQIINFGKKDFLEEIKKLKSEELFDLYNGVIEDLSVLLGESLYSKMILVKELADSDEPRERIEKWIAVLYQLFLYKQGNCNWDKKTLTLLGSLEKKLKYDTILEALEKMLNLLNLLDTNVSKRIMFEDFILQI